VPWEVETRKKVYVKPGMLENRRRGLKAAMLIRKSVEHLFGDVKTWHGMRRPRYRGLGRVTIQVLMTLIVANAKKMAKRIEGVLSANTA
jgi:IS5 family transposase